MLTIPEHNHTLKPGLKGYSAKAYFKFICLSSFGIFAFFMNFPLPNYQLSVFGWQFGTVSANSTMLVTHLTGLIRAALWSGNFKAMPAIIWLFGVYCLYDIFILRFNSCWKTTNLARIFSVFKTLGFILLTFTILNYYFGIHPALFDWYFAGRDFIGGAGIAFFVMDRILISISITIPLAAAFLPFLTGYGLVDFVGVIVRRVMRPVFRLPGRAAVIAVSALLASFVVGHIAANNEYKSGYMTQRESMIIATSLTSASIGFMLVLAQNTNIMHIWNIYLWSTFLIVLVVTIICARIYPLSKIPNTYREGVTPIPEKIYTDHITRYAVKEALETASKADDFGKRLAGIMKETLGVLGTCATGSTFFSAVGIVLYMYTPILTWVGYIFVPFMLIAIPQSEVMTASSGAALSFIEITLPSLLVATGEWSLRIRYMMAVVPVTAVVFLASWVPCIMATSLPVKFSHLIIIWLQRMILSIIITSLFALVLFPAGAV